MVLPRESIKSFQGPPQATLFRGEEPFAAPAIKSIAPSKGGAAAFTYYVSVARDLSFGRRFVEMASLSLIVAVISFGIGYALRAWTGIEM